MFKIVFLILIILSHILYSREKDTLNWNYRYLISVGEMNNVSPYFYGYGPLIGISVTHKRGLIYGLNFSTTFNDVNPEGEEYAINSLKLQNLASDNSFRGYSISKNSYIGYRWIMLDIGLLLDIYNVESDLSRSSSADDSQNYADIGTSLGVRMLIPWHGNLEIATLKVGTGIGARFISNNKDLFVDFVIIIATKRLKSRSERNRTKKVSAIQ